MTFKSILNPLLLIAMMGPAVAWSASYTLPGNSSTWPPGCSIVGSVVTCNNLNLNSVDVITVTSPVTLRINGGTLRGAINVGGTPANLNIGYSGGINFGDGAQIVANMNGGNIWGSASNVQITGNVSMSGQIGLGSNSLINGNLNTTGDLQLGTGSRVNGTTNANNINSSGANNIVLDGAVTVSGQISLGNTLRIHGPVTSNSMNVGSDAQIYGAVTASSVTMGSNPYILGNVQVQNQISTGNCSSVSSLCGINGNITAGSLMSGERNTFTGTIATTGQMRLGNNGVINGNVTANSVDINSNATVNGTVVAQQDVNLQQGATVNGNVTSVNAQINASSDNITINGAATAAGNVNLGSNGIVNGPVTAVNGAVNASSNNITIDGPVSAFGNVNLGSNGTVNGNITAGGSLNASSSGINIEGNVSVGGQINLGGIIQGNANANGNVNLGSSGNCVINSAGYITSGQGCIGGYVNAPNAENLPPTSVGGCVCDVNANQGPCSNCGTGGSGVLFYQIEHSGTALTCEAEPIQIHACTDPTCTNKIAVTGGVTLQASGAQNQVAMTAFVDSPTANLLLALPVAGNYTLSISSAAVPADNPFQCAEPSGCNISAVDAALRWQTLPTQTAGVPFTATLEAVRTDNQTGACVTAVQGLTEVDVGVKCVDPDSCYNGGALLEVEDIAVTEVPLMTAVSVSFNASGVADVDLNYQDAGRIRLHATATLPGIQISGISSDFVVRPAAIGFTITNPNPRAPGISSSVPIFAQAGDELNVVLTARSATGQATPNFGQEAQPEVLTLAPTATPVGGIAGSVQIEDPFTISSEGEFTSSDVRYTEAGRVRFTAHVTSLNYLGTGNLTAQSEVLGRFLPWEFDVDNALVLPACTDGSPQFSYFEQPFPVALDITARNRNGDVTQNYPDQGEGAEAVMVARDRVTDETLTDRLMPGSLEPVWATGVANLQTYMALARLQDDALDGPYQEMQIAVWMDDREVGGPFVPTTSASAAAGSFSDSDPDCVTNGTCNSISIVGSQRQVFGQLVLTDTFGSEMGNLPITVQTHFWDGTRFRLHSADNCTELDPALFVINENLSDLDTEVDGTSGPLIAGQVLPGTLYWTAPDEAGSIRFTYPAPDWLKFGEDDDGNPTANAVFGNYGGHDRVIYWRLKTD